MYQLVTVESVDEESELPPAWIAYVNPSIDDEVYKNFSNESNPFLTSFIFETVLSLSFLIVTEPVVQNQNLNL